METWIQQNTPNFDCAACLSALSERQTYFVKSLRETTKHKFHQICDVFSFKENNDD